MKKKYFVKVDGSALKPSIVWCGVAGGEQVPLGPLDWYFSKILSSGNLRLKKSFTNMFTVSILL